MCPGELRIGQGIDVHPFEKGRPLVLGGVCISHEFGLGGHSDADVLLHALVDALLGAVGKGDIGSHFPDTEDAYRNIDTKVLLKKAWDLLRAERWEIVNLDCTVMAEAPRLSPFIPKMQEAISAVLDVAPEKCSIKATTSEKMGFVGRGEGILAAAVVLLKRDGQV